MSLTFFYSVHMVFSWLDGCLNPGFCSGLGNEQAARAGGAECPPTRTECILQRTGKAAFIAILTEAEFLDEIETKVLRVFLLLYSKSPPQLCHEIYISSNSRNLIQFLQCVTVHCKGERRKTLLRTTPPSLWFKKSIQKLRFWDSQDSADVDVLYTF